MQRLWFGLVVGMLSLAGCGKAPPAIPVDAAVLDDRHCAASGMRECTLLATGDGRFVLAVPGRRTRPDRRPPAAARGAGAGAIAAAGAAAGGGRGGVRLLISLPQQKLYAYRGDTLVATSPVSTGKAGHRTPTGTFRVLQKAVTHHSNKYSNAPMPHMQRLTTYGIAIHGGALPGYPASHGCIRLLRAFARTLYRMTRNGTVVTITNARPRVTGATGATGAARATG